LKSKLLAALDEIGVAFPADGIVTSGDIRWQAVFFMGRAGSGKTFIRDKKYLTHAGFKVVDPDAIKKLHPDYDPERPYIVHTWSKKIADSEFKDIVTSGNGDSLVVDGTGRSALGLTKKIKLAEQNGYRTFLVYVWVPLEISLFRNRNRKRFIEEDVVLATSPLISRSFGQLKKIVDKFKIVPNFSKVELLKAKKDLEIYPPPQADRPPRPGNPDYGIVSQVASLGSNKSKIASKKVAGELIKIAKILIGVRGRLKSL